MVKWKLVGAALLAVVVVGCGEKPAPAPAPVAKPVEPGLKELKVTTLAKGQKTLYFPMPKPVAEGDTVWVQFTGTLKDGTVFDSTIGEDGRPYSYPMDPKGMIKGWYDGTLGMQLGEERKLEVPAALAYGENSPNDAIPANSDLYFTIKVLDIVKKGEENAYEKADKKVGSGKEAKAGSLVTFHYEAQTILGTVFDSSRKRGSPMTMRLDGTQIQPEALERSMIGMKEGGIRVVRIPPAVGLPLSDRMDADGPQYFFVELLKVEEE